MVGSGNDRRFDNHPATSVNGFGAEAGSGSSTGLGPKEKS